MASTNKTLHYLLSKFLGTDRLQRSDYNNDMDIIDGAMKGLEDNKIPNTMKTTTGESEKIPVLGSDGSLSAQMTGFSGNSKYYTPRLVGQNIDNKPFLIILTPVWISGIVEQSLVRGKFHFDRGSISNSNMRLNAEIDLKTAYSTNILRSVECENFNFGTVDYKGKKYYCLYTINNISSMIINFEGIFRTSDTSVLFPTIVSDYVNNTDISNLTEIDNSKLISSGFYKRILSGIADLYSVLKVLIKISSTNAFEVQNSSGTTSFKVDTSNDKIVANNAEISDVIGNAVTTSGLANKIFKFSDIANTWKAIFKIMKSSTNAFRVAKDNDTEVFNVDTTNEVLGGSAISESKTPSKVVKRDSNGNIAGVLNTIEVKAITRNSTIPNTLAEIDGYIPTVGDLILIASIDGHVNDGIYEVKPSGTTWTRPSVYDNENEIINTEIKVINGTNFKNTIWYCNNFRNVVIGTTIMKFRLKNLGFIKHDINNVRMDRLSKNETILTQYHSSNPDVSPVINGSQHFILQMSTLSEETSEASAYGAQIAMNYGATPRMAIRTFDPSNYSSWVEIASQDYVKSQSFGVGQSYQDVKTGRNANQLYINSTGRTIEVHVCLSNSSAAASLFYEVGGIIFRGDGATIIGEALHCSFAVPPGVSYKAYLNSGTTTVVTWVELR